MERSHLSHATSAEPNIQVTSNLPPEVVQCLTNTRFLHLATCVDNEPHVSLMHFTYLPSSPYSTGPVIVMTTNPSSKKTHNLVANPKVSLLVHDLVSIRPLGGSLSSVLQTLNSMASQMSADAITSATINGSARVLEPGSDEERFLRDKHLESNTLRGDTTPPSQQGVDGLPDDSGDGYYLAGEDVRVVLVEIRDVRISDREGSARVFAIQPETNGGS